MGIIRKTLLTGLTGAASATAFVGYLHSSTSIICPLPPNDPIWSSAPYNRYNVHKNPSTQDVVLKRIPIDKIKPELLEKDGALVTEFCRGVWAGWGHGIQRRYLARKYQGPRTASQLWSKQQLRTSDYEPGTLLVDHFEVVEKTPTSITVRCGDSPLNAGPRPSDGIFVISAEVDKERNEVELGLKSCFFSSHQRIEGIAGPMPLWMEMLHTEYARSWMVAASSWLTR